jgi:hypothetical protein
VIVTVIWPGKAEQATKEKPQARVAAPNQTYLQVHLKSQLVCLTGELTHVYQPADSTAQHSMQDRSAQPAQHSMHDRSAQHQQNNFCCADSHLLHMLCWPRIALLL